MLRRFVTGSVFLALGLGASSASAAFQAGDVFYIGQAGTVVLATAGGNLSGQMLADAQGYVAGEIAFSADRSTMYFCMPNDGKVMAMDSSGTMQSFATGLTHPIGIAVLSDGHILATEWDAGEVTDITAGGDFTSATPLVQGLQRARHLLQRNDGTILVTDEYANEVLTLNYPATGVASTPFASSLLLVKSLAETADGKLYATTQWNVFDITQGGGFANKPVFASGQNFMGLAVDAQGKLLAAPRCSTSPRVETSPLQARGRRVCPSETPPSHECRAPSVATARRSRAKTAMTATWSTETAALRSA